MRLPQLAVVPDTKSLKCSHLSPEFIVKYNNIPLHFLSFYLDYKFQTANSFSLLKKNNVMCRGKVLKRVRTSQKLHLAM